MLTRISTAQQTIMIGLELVCGVIFGTPSRNCTGSGICMVSSLQTLRRKRYPCDHVMAYLGQGINGELTIRIPFTAVPEALRRQFFRDKIFKVDETFQIPPWLTSPWGKYRIYIPPGRYEIQKSADSWIIIFPQFQTSDCSTFPTRN